HSAALPHSLRSLFLFPTYRSRSPELGTAEAQDAVPVRGLAAVAVRRAHILRVAAPRAAPDHAAGGRGGVFLRVVIVGPDVFTPLEDVAQCVVEAPVVGDQLGDRTGLTLAVLPV